MIRATAIATIVLAGIGMAPAASAQSQLFTDNLALIAPLPLSPVSQQNAVQKAKDYLSFSAFSRSGLIEQLQYSGFTGADATYAVDSLNVDWNLQAVKKAKEYLSFSAFSESGLIEQLEYSGFTPSQAAYGVSVAYR